ncbi:unnamed protein product [Caenorhabditis auriculariae]|uniref:Uncharacterized protein n=1 Tax=Caenorhabditis auriculariae TaxID=2777116 RepID=A0A8S1H0H3_9PELO|nr:unnamed protein product [Caenorhabditis auriculariae]
MLKREDFATPKQEFRESCECSVCAAPSTGYHFNAPACSACAAFFRRTVTLNRVFFCSRGGGCEINYTMRVICRCCRYAKCIEMGMERAAVQPRRDCNSGRRKIVYASRVEREYANISTQTPNALDVLASAMDMAGMSPESNYVPSSSNSDSVPSPSNFQLKYDFEAENLLEGLLREERLVNERRKLLYCAHNSISNLLTTENVNDIPFSKEDLHELTFAGIQKHIRPQILITYEWLRGWRHFEMLNTHDRLIFLRRCVLYHTILDPAYLTTRLGLPDRFVMFNAMFVNADGSSEDGWRDEENTISADLKIKLYRPLMLRVLNEICISMHSTGLSFVEFVVLKALVSFKSASSSDISPELKTFMSGQLNVLFKALNWHYRQISLPMEIIAERMGNVILLMSSIFAVGMECLESHHKIQFFDLWQLDDLLLKLISTPRGGGL